MNAQQAKEYAAANGFTIENVGKRYKVTHTASGTVFERGGYAAVGNEMVAIVNCENAAKTVEPAFEEPQTATGAEPATRDEARANHVEQLRDVLNATGYAPVIDESPYRFVLRVTFKESIYPWGNGAVIYCRSRADALKAARRELSGTNGKNVAHSVIEPV